MNAVQRKVICAYKQMFAALMVIALVVWMMPLASMTALANTQEILTIVCGEEKTIETDGSETVFSFIPETDGVYAFYSYNNSMDTYGCVLDADWNTLAEDDDSAGDMNFKVTYTMIAGECYYLASRSYSGDESGSYYVKLEQVVVPIQSMVFEPITFMAGVGGYWDTAYNQETDTYDLEYYRYDIYNYLEYTIIWNDGTTSIGTGSGVEHNGEWYSFDVKDNQSYENQWLPGNTYTANVFLWEFPIEAEVEVSILASPVQSIEIAPVSFIKETEGYWSTDYNWETDEYDLEYYRYDVYNHLEYTITWDDGTTSSGTGSGVEYNGEWYSFDINDDQSYENQWLPGNTYTVTASLMGVSTEVDFNILESPLRSITVSPISIIEGTNGYWSSDYNAETDTYDLEYYHYSPENMMTYTVVWNDGTITTGKRDSIEYKGEEYWFDIVTDQSYDNQWTAGNTYSMTIRLMGASTIATVEITDTPVKAITVEPVTVYEKIDSYLHTTSYDDVVEQYEHYSIESELRITVEWKDGTTTIHPDYYDIEYNGRQYSATYKDDQSFETPWKPDHTYYGEVCLMGVSAEVTVCVKASPVNTVELLKAPDKTQYEIGEYFNPQGSTLRIWYVDDTYEDITMGKGANLISFTSCLMELQKIDKEIEVDISQFTAEPTSTSYQLKLLDQAVNIPVTISNREAQVITVRNDDADLYITVTYKGGSQHTYKALGLNTLKGDGADDFIMRGGVLITDGGLFDVEIYKNLSTDEVYLKWWNGYQYITSNTIDSCLWWELQMRIDDIAQAIVSQHNETVKYEGSVTADNIDDLLSIMCSAIDLKNDSTAVVTGWTFRADSVKVAFYEFYGIMPDLSLSEKYDSKAKTIGIDIRGWGGFGYMQPVSIEQTAEGFDVQLEWYYTDQVISFVLNRELQLKTFLIEENSCQGDINGDGILDTSDARLALKNIVGLTDFTAEQTQIADMNEDGKLNSADVRRMLLTITANAS